MGDSPGRHHFSNFVIMHLIRNWPILLSGFLMVFYIPSSSPSGLLKKIPFIILAPQEDSLHTAFGGWDFFNLLAGALFDLGRSKIMGGPPRPPQAHVENLYIILVLRIFFWFISGCALPELLTGIPHYVCSEHEHKIELLDLHLALHLDLGLAPGFAPGPRACRSWSHGQSCQTCTSCEAASMPADTAIPSHMLRWPHWSWSEVCEEVPHIQSSADACCIYFRLCKIWGIRCNVEGK